MWRNLIVAIIVGCAMLVGVVISRASIPGPDGVIHGCVKTSNGALIAIDSSASCPSGFTALNWNQTGPAGSPGVSGLEKVDQFFAGPWLIGQNHEFQMQCPSGKTIISGGFDASQDAGPVGPSIDASFPSSTTGWVFEIDPTTTLDYFAGHIICANVN